MPSKIECPVYRDSLCPDIITAKEQLKHLRERETTQNGHLGRIDEKMDELKDCLNAKLDRLNLWIIGLLGSALLAVALLAADLVSKRI